jgi:3-dehydroquinate synthase
MKPNGQILSYQRIVIELQGDSYELDVGPGVINKTGSLIKQQLHPTSKCAVVTSSVVNEIHGESVFKSMNKAGIDTGIAEVPEGEIAKSWHVAEQLIGDLLDLGLDRTSVVIAFGGGTVGDLAGFVASIFLRGIRLVHVPTTLLAQVDSSIGGKTAINHPKGKNLIGSIYQPSLIVSDQNLLSTLPRREILSGLAEVIKHGVIADAALFEYVDKNAEKLLIADPEALANVVSSSITIKGKFVALDEKDTKGIRAALNYGHTTGHALEALTSWELRHGEAVALGMIVAAGISKKLGLMEQMEIDRQRRLLEKLGFYLEPPELDAKEIIEVMHMDKKAREGSIRFVVPTGIGRPPALRAIPENLILQVLEEEGYG